MNSKKFTLADPNTKIIRPHKCEACKSVIYDVYECQKNKCTFYCKDHQPKNGECTECGEKGFSYNKELTKKINEIYEINCAQCNYKMKLASHLLPTCKMDANYCALKNVMKSS